HAAADEAALTREGRRGTLPDDDERNASVCFLPGEVVMVVDRADDRRAENLPHALDDQLAAGVGVLAGDRHRLEVILSARPCEREQQRRRFHFAFGASALPAAALRDPHEAGRRAMTEAARSEVDANPYLPVFVFEQVDVMVAAADGAELVLRELQQVTLLG